MSNGFEDLKRTVQRLREVDYPDLPEDLVDAILVAERDDLERRDAAVREVRRAVADAAQAATDQTDREA